MAHSPCLSRDSRHSYSVGLLIRLSSHDCSCPLAPRKSSDILALYKSDYYYYYYNPNGISIGSAVFAEMTAECPFTMERPFPSSKLPLSCGELDPHGSLGPPKSSTQTVFRLVQPFFCRAHYIDRQTDRSTDRQTTLIYASHHQHNRNHHGCFGVEIHKFLPVLDCSKAPPCK